MGATFVGEDKSAIVVFDILSSELMKSTFSEDCEVIIISPWVKDYPIPSTWPNFSSNFIGIKNMQRISDILKKITQNITIDYGGNFLATYQGVKKNKSIDETLWEST